MRCMTWNVEYTVCTPAKVEAVAAAIRRADPDVLCLQELTDELWAALRPLLDFEYTTGVQYFLVDKCTLGRMAWEPGPVIGNAICSKWPLADVRSVPFCTKTLASRGFVVATVCSSPSVSVLCTHLDSSARRWRTRVQQIKQLVGEAGVDVLTGDMNCAPPAVEFRQFRLGGWVDGWTDAVDPGYTEDTKTNPRRRAVMQERGRAGEERRVRFDHVWTKAGGRWIVSGARVLTECTASDHYAVVAELTPRPRTVVVRGGAARRQ